MSAGIANKTGPVPAGYEAQARAALEEAIGGARKPKRIVIRSETAVLIMPDDTPAHPYEPAIESAMLAPKAEMTFFPWKDTKDKIPLAVRHVRTFLRANRP